MNPRQKKKREKKRLRDAVKKKKEECAEKAKVKKEVKDRAGAAWEARAASSTAPNPESTVGFGATLSPKTPRPPPSTPPGSQDFPNMD